MPLNLRPLIARCMRLPGGRWIALAGVTLAIGALALLDLTPRHNATPTAAPATAVAVRPKPSTPAVAATTAPPQIQSAAFGADAIDVIVKSNDTLDGIFRRLKLDLSDLAFLRSLPGLKARLDSLRPGELLHLVHRDSSLVGLERRLNDTQTLKVTRANDQLHASVLDNPLATRVRT